MKFKVEIYDRNGVMVDEDVLPSFVGAVNRARGRKFIIRPVREEE